MSRGGELTGGPGADFVLRGGDVLTVQGRLGDFREFLSWQALEMASGTEITDVLSASKVAVMTAGLAEDSELAGLLVRETDFAGRFGVHILAIQRGKSTLRRPLAEVKLEEDDFLVLEGRRESLEDLQGRKELREVRLAGREELADVRPESELLIAGMIPLGTAMDTTGAAKWIAHGVSVAAEPFGLWGILLGIYLLTALATTIVPTTALVLIMAPIVFFSLLVLNRKAARGG